MTKRGLPFRWLGGDVDWAEHGGKWYAGPFAECLEEVGGYTYFFVLEWEPDTEYDSKGGWVGLKIVSPAMWSAYHIERFMNDFADCGNEPFEGDVFQALIDWPEAPYHRIYSKSVSTRGARVDAFREAKTQARNASFILGAALDAGCGWFNIRGDHPICPPGRLELKAQATLGIVLALTTDDKHDLTDELTAGDAYTVSQTISQFWFERWLATNAVGYRRRRKR